MNFFSIIYKYYYLDLYLNWFLPIEFHWIIMKVYHKLLNAYDFGLPQNRDRIFIVGINRQFKDKFDFPKPLDKTTPLYKISL